MPKAHRRRRPIAPPAAAPSAAAIAELAAAAAAQLAAAKDRARAAWEDAKAKHAAADVLCDRWFSETLLAVDDAPERVQATMWARTELLFKLLIDRRCWLAERDAQGRIIESV